jgi:hypothetical protein
MTTVIKIDLLPQKVRTEFDRKLIEQGFGGHQPLCDWLEEQGHSISADSIGRYARDLKAEIGKLRIAHNFATAYGYELPDDDGVVAKMLTGLIQAASYRALVQIVQESQSLDKDSDLNGFLRRLETCSRILSNATRSDVATITVAKHAADVRAKQEARMNELQSEAVAQGISSEFMDRMRREILGMGD